MRYVAVLVFSLSCTCAVARADTVVFKNGDRLTGSLVDVRSGNLTLASEVLGTVTIPLSQVASYASAVPAVIVRTDEQIARGQVELAPTGDWQVTEAGSSQTVSAASVSAILTADSYSAQFEQRPKVWENWDGAVNFGYSISRGDQDTRTLSSTVDATREGPYNLIFRPHFRTNYNLTMLFSRAEQTGSFVSSNTITTRLRQDYLFSMKDFVFGFGQLDHIDAQGLYLRKTVGGGFGRDLIRSERMLLSALGGINYVHEKFTSGLSMRNAEASLGENLGFQINSRLRLDHALTFYPNLTEGGQYRGDMRANLSARIYERLTANIGVIDLYLSNPSPGSQKNNVAFTTGLGVTF
jgi:putative salt-induced outer membrane protein YdiY